MPDHSIRAIALAMAVLGGCASEPTSSISAGDSPVGAVREYLGHVTTHDLPSLRVCSQPYPDGYNSLLISGLFEPVGALPGSDIARTLALIDFDASRVTITERSRLGGEAEVEVGGILVERFEPGEVEALFRAYAAEAGQPIELDLLLQTVENVSRGPVEIPVRERVPVVLEGDTWRVCPPAVHGEPTPGSFHLKSQPRTAPRALTIRVGDDSPSRWGEEVSEGAPIWITQTTLPDDDQAIWLDDEACEGLFAIEAGVETDLLLVLTGEGCRVEVLGTHPEGQVQHRFVP